MRKILIATHATYAEGIRAAAELILGKQPDHHDLRLHGRRFSGGGAGRIFWRLRTGG